MLFEFKIYDVHSKQTFTNDGELIHTPIDTDNWAKFDFAIDTEFIKIIAFRSFVLIDSNNNPTPCTKVFLDDNSVVYACLSYDTFSKRYKDLSIETSEQQ